MDTTKRKVSPRYPTLSLDEAIDRIQRVYKEEGRHATPVEVALKHLGYSGKSGASLQTVASLGYWGLLERPKDGMLMVTKEFEDYVYTPDEEHKRSLLIGFMRNPPLFTELLERYKDRLPSEGNIKFDLIQKGFNPIAAATCVTVFKRSVEFVGYYDSAVVSLPVAVGKVGDVKVILPEMSSQKAQMPALVTEPVITTPASTVAPVMASSGLRIPVKLTGGRCAWLEIPTPFFTADKERMKAYIDLQLADDEDTANAANNM